MARSSKLQNQLQEQDTEAKKKVSYAYEPPDHALGLSRRGFSTKIHLVCDGKGLPLNFFITAGQRQECKFACLILRVLLRKTPHRHPKYIAADKGYDAKYVHKWLQDHHIKDAIKRIPQKPISKAMYFPKRIYKRRNIIERCIGRLKEKRALATRFDKLARVYSAEVWLIFVRQYLAILKNSS